MRSLRRWTALLLAVALILGVAGMAGANAPDVIGTRFEESVGYLMNLGVIAGYPDGTYRPAATITRAESTKIIIAITQGSTTMADLLRGATPFSDVPGAHWASGFIALAKNLSIVNGYPDGTFKPEAPVTFTEFAKMLCAAAGVPPAAGLSWPANYVSAALNSGMLNGVTGFEANAPAPRGECAIMTAYTVKEVANPATGMTLAQSVFGESLVASVTVTPASTTVAIGAGVQMVATAKAADGTVLPNTVFTWTVSDPSKAAVNSSGFFASGSSGTFTVTVSAGDATATATIAVYGAATALRATPETATVPANGASVVTVNVEVVDATGVRVLSDSSTMVAVAHDTGGDNGAVDFAADPVKVKNGLATFELTASLNSDVTDTVKFTAGELTSDTVMVTTVDQIASAIKLTATPTDLMANEINSGTVTAAVVDQAGKAMVTGIWELTFSIAGVGTMEGDTEAITRVTSGQTAQVGVESLMGDPGTFTVSCTGPGLTAGTVQVTTYIAGSPTSLRVTVEDGTTVAGLDDTDDDGLSVTIKVVDKNGHAVKATSDITLNFAYSDAAGLDLGATGYIASGDMSETFLFTGTKVGTWTVTVSDAAGTLTGTSFAVTITPGAAATLVLTPDLADHGLWLPLSNPKVTFSAYVEDAYGNRVAEAGIDLVFSATALGTGTGSFPNGGEVTTASNGSATVQFTAGAYAGGEYSIMVETADTESWTASAETVEHVYVTDTLPGSMTIVTRNSLEQTISSTVAGSGERVYTTVSVKDTNGNPIDAVGSPKPDGWLVEIRFSNDGKNVTDVADWGADNNWTEDPENDGVYWAWTSESTVDFSFEGATAGSFSITATALEPLVKVSKSHTFLTKAGGVADAAVFKTDGTLATDVEFAADQVVALRVALVDAGGNQVVATTTRTVDLSASWGGEYRASSGGTAITSVTIAAGQSAVTVYFVSDTASPDDGVDLSNDATLVPIP